MVQIITDTTSGLPGEISRRYHIPVIPQIINIGSESYLEGMPGWFQEPLINAFAKIAQWRGEDRELYKYFR